MRINLMKTSLIITIFCLLFVACSSDDDNSLNDNVKIEIENNVKNDSWRITKYIDSGDDELNHFTGYNFTFGENSVLTATNGINTYIGSWSITDSNSNDDSQSDLEFNIFFTTPSDFEELSDDWHFITQSSAKIELIDISGGNGGTDYLTFEKN